MIKLNEIYSKFESILPANIKKVCVEDPEIRKELIESFALKYDVDLNEDKVFNAIDFILLKTNEILSK